jgi:predicted DNA-binding transcriptional regulator YafY
MLIALQQRGRMTATQLAAELEVSVRTVLRDVDTLSAAGVPIYAVPGAGGGIEVLDGFRTQLTGFTPDEGAAVLLAGQPALAAALGLEAAASAARRKLLQALPAEPAGAAVGLDTWFLHDPGRPDTDPEQLRILARAIRSRVEVRLGPSACAPAEVLRPLGLVLAAGAWLVVHLATDGPRIRAVTELGAPGVLGRRFTPPDDFDLGRFWRSRPS